MIRTALLGRSEPSSRTFILPQGHGHMISNGSTLLRDEYTAVALRRYDTPEILVTVTRHRGRSRTTPHTHEGPYLCLVSSGNFLESGPHQVLTVSAGNVIAHPGCDSHADQFGALDVECINFAPRAEGRVAALFSETIVRPAFWIDAHLLHRVRGELRTDDRWTPVALEILAVEMLTGHARSREVSRPSPWCSDLRDFIRDESPRVPTLAELATRARVHPAHLSKVFRAAFGASPVEFGRQYRAAWTRQKIESSPTSLSQLAMDAGYADHSHMCRDLRRRYGVAPRQLRAGEFHEGVPDKHVQPVLL